METLHLRARRADARAPAVIGGVRADLAERLDLFHPAVRERVRALALTHPRLADLAFSFPALLVALAAPRFGTDPRGAIARVVAGDPLAAIAHAADTPMWLRKLAPGAFAEPIPALPDGPIFRRQIVNHLPADLARAPLWLERVSQASAWCGEALALLLAREIAGAPAAAKETAREWKLLALWAWHALHPDAPAHRFLETRFVASMSIAHAVEAARLWQQNLIVHLYFAGAPLDDVWFRAGEFEGYDFQPLATEDAIIAEARAMNHCVRAYGRDAALNQCRLWSMRKDGARVATIRIACPYRQPLPQIVELEGPGNTAQPPDVWWCARRWLDSHDLPALDMRRKDWSAHAISQTHWVRLWKPYWRAVGRAPEWLPMRASYDVIELL